MINEMTRKLIVLVATMVLVDSTYANPVGGVVTSGSATITSPNSTTVQINQTSNKAIINWHSFNIAPNEQTRFVQPSSNSIALNRVDPNQGVSQIYGHLSANGKIILINGAGIYFGPNARVDVGGIIASTSDMSDKNFIAGNYVFDQPSLHNGSVVNQGQIIARNNGLVALVGSSVSNEGVIQAHGGNVVLASGNKFTVSLSGDQLINFTVDEASSSAGVDKNGNKLKNAVNNSGTILADGGTILMTAKTAQHIVDNVINMSGVAEAHSVQQRNGEIILLGEDTGGTGNVLVSGKIDVSGDKVKGGTAKVLGNQIQIASSAVINASGDRGGGNIVIGGNAHGKGPDLNASQTTVAKGAVIKANASVNGDGGNIVVWSNDNTQFHGTLSATGGPLGGNGGFIETSGGYLDVSGATVDLKAPLGSFGTWLLDPTSIFIADSQANATAVGMTGVDATADQYSSTNPITFNASGGAAESLLTTGTLLAALANGNVVVTTDNSSAAGSGDIYVVNDILWSNATSLTLSAYRHVVLQGSVQNGVGANIKVIADNTGTGTGTVCGGGGTTVCSGISPTITVTPSGFLRSFFSPAGAVTVYYNPQTFGVQDTIYTGGTTPTRYMLINSLGGPNDTTGASLASLTNNINNFNFSMANQNYALSKDIDASATSSAPWTIIGFRPIGNTTLLFTGRFDGLGHTISNLYVNSSTSVAGLFGAVGSPSIISNIKLVNPSINGAVNGVNVGAIVGQTNANTTVTNVSSTGGTVGFTGTIGTLGGLVGNLGGVLSNSYNATAVTANTLSSPFSSNVGGLVGIVNSSASIATSYNTGLITVNGSAGTPLVNMGGIAGNNQSGISQSISNSYNIGNLALNTSNIVSIGGTLGGIVGLNGGSASVVNTYNLGNINSTNYTGTKGGLVGTNSGSLSNSFWNTVTTGQAIAVGSGNACPTCGSSNLQLASTYSAAGWNIGLPGSGSTWQILNNVIYPHLVTEGLYTVEGTVYSDSSGTTPVGAGITVNLVSNGALLSSTSTDASGHYQFLYSATSANPVPGGNLVVGSNLLIYPSTGSVGNVVFQTNGQTVTTANIYNTKLITGVTNGNAASNTILSSAKGGLATSEIVYNFSGNNLTTLYGTSIEAKTKYRLDGNMTTGTGGGILFDGSLTLVSPSTTIETLQGGDITFNDLNGAGKNLTIKTSGFNTDMIKFNTVSNKAQSISVQGDLSGNDGLTFLDDPLTQNWKLGTSYGALAQITGLTNIGTFTFNGIRTLVGTGAITAPNASNNTWNVTGPLSGNAIIVGSNYTFSGFKTLQTGSDSESTNVYTIQPGGHVNNIFGVLGNNNTTVDFSAYGSPLTLTANDITTPDGVTNLSYATIIGNDGTSGSSGNVIGNSIGIDGQNSGTVGTLGFSGFGNALGIDGGDNLFTFSGGGALAGNLVGGSTGGTNTMDLTNAVGSPINFTFTGSGTGSHGARGTSSVLGGTYDNIDVINNNSDSGNTLTGVDVGAFFTLNGVGAGSANILDLVTTLTFSGFPNIVGATGPFVSNNFTINPGSDFISLYGGANSGSTTQFILNGGNVDFIDGGLGAFSTLMPFSTPATVNITGPNSGNVTGSATVGSFVNIRVIQQGGTGNTYNVDSSITSLSVTSNANVVIGATGNVGTVSGGSDNTYDISGTIGDLLAGSGVNAYTLNDGASITNLFGNGSDSLTMNTSGGNTWNVNGTSGNVGGGGASIGNYSGVTNLIGSNNGDTFNLDGALNSVTGGSGSDIFQLATTSSLGFLNGGGGINTLRSAPGNSNWTISGLNSGSVGGTGGFSNIQNMVGSATGLNTFVFTGGGAVSGLIDGGNMANVSVVDVSGKLLPVDLVLGSTKIGGVLQEGTLSSGGVPFANFQQIQSAIGNGGNITVPDSAVSSIQLNPGSTTAGMVGDPFFFNGFFPIQLGGGPTPVVPPALVSAETNISNITAVLILGDLINVPQSFFVEQNLEDLINSQINEDIMLSNNTTFCFR